MSTADLATWDDLAEAVIVADRSGRIRFANASCRSVLGWDPASLVGRELVELIPLHLRAAHLSSFARRMRQGQGSLAGRPIRVTALGPGGEERAVELLISAPDGPATTVIGTLRPAADPEDVDPRSALTGALVAAWFESAPTGSSAAAAAAAAVADALSWDVVALWSVSDDRQHLRCEAYEGSSPPGRFESATRASLLPPGVDLPGRVWGTGAPLWVDELAADPAFLRAPAAEATGLRSGAAFPITGAGGLVAVLECFQTTPRPFDAALVDAMADTQRLLGSMLDRGQDEADRARLLSEIQAERARLQAVLRQLPLGVVITDATGDVITTNDVADALLGEAGGAQGDVGAAALLLGPVPASELVEILDEQRRMVDLRSASGRAVHVAVRSSPVRDARDRVVSWVTTLSDETEEQRERHRLELLARAGEALAGSLDIDSTLKAVAAMSVPGLADLCAVDLVDGSGVRRVAAEVDGDAEQLAAADEVSARYQPLLGEAAGVSRVLATGQPTVISEVTDDHLRTRARDSAHLDLLRRIGLRSIAIVPLVGGGRTLGAMTIATVTAERALSDRDVALAVELGRRAGLAVTNAQLHERVREVAEALQVSLLPPTLPEIAGVDLGARLLPGGEGMVVGGDFYDVYPIDDRRWAITLGDVCGHGAEAAAVTARVRYGARAARERDDPVALFGVLNSVLLPAQDASSRFCTLVHAVVEPTPAGAQITVGSAGHPPPMHVSPTGEVTELSCGGTLLGVLEAVTHEDESVLLAPGASLVLYTDGVTEARGPGGFFGEAGLRAVLRRTVGASAGQVADAVAEGVLTHAEGTTTDDVAVVVIRAVEDDR